MPVSAHAARRGGILLHPSSLPGPHGIGDLGAGARAFVDWLHSAGLSIWQVLPLVPPGAGDSPYSSGSAFLGNPWLIDLEGLLAMGLLDRDDLDAPPFPERRVDFGRMRAFKGPRLDKAARRLLGHPPKDLATELRAFRDEATWAEEGALFFALRAKLDAPWWKWPAELRDGEPGAVAKAYAEVSEAVDMSIATQFLFERQLASLRRHCDKLGISLLGDIPIYVDLDSADVWRHRRLFRLDAEGRPEAVAGVPPDAFSETGQLWGNPLYRWDVMKDDGYAWWKARLRRVLSQTDIARIDHFRAFAEYWEVPADATDARSGKWVEGPGRGFFDAIRDELGELPIVAEDLGIIDEQVRKLRRDVALPGMRVLQFGFGEDDTVNPHLPHMHTPDSVAYTGTHDNDTTLGWWIKASDKTRDHVRRYFGIDGHDIVWNFIRAALASPARLAVVPMQDTLALDSEARMNTPAVATGNWGWRVGWDGLRGDIAYRLCELARLYDRLNPRCDSEYAAE